MGVGGVRIGITGSSGLLGWHLRCLLRTKAGVEPINCYRSQFSDDSFMRDFVNQSDAIVHFAGMNRGEDPDIEETNVALAERLVHFASRSGRRPHIVYSSTVHMDRDTAYGRSKRAAGQLLLDWAEGAGARCTVLVLPHVYGECGRPFYNSVVSTFCYQLANDLEPCVHGDGRLELLHAQDAAQTALTCVEEELDGLRRVDGIETTVLEILHKLQNMAGHYREAIVPPLDTAMDLRLFNTYRSYLFPDRYPIRFTEHKDARGRLFECVRTLHGGQCFVSFTRPGVTRGNHFHTRKFERFAVVSGEAIIRLRRLFDDTIHEFRVSGADPVCVDMPTFHTHSIENTGDQEVITLFWSHELFDPADPDTFPEQVRP